MLLGYRAVTTCLGDIYFIIFKSIEAISGKMKLRIEFLYEPQNTELSKKMLDKILRKKFVINFLFLYNKKEHLNSYILTCIIIVKLIFFNGSTIAN